MLLIFLAAICATILILLLWIKYEVIPVQKEKWQWWAGIMAIGILTFYLNSLLWGRDDRIVDSLNIWGAYVLLAAFAGIDFKKKIIPNKLLLLGFSYRTILLMADIFTGKQDAKTILLQAALGFLFGLLFFLILSFISKSGVGYGDVKLFAWIGYSFGVLVTYNILFYSALLAAVAGIFLLLFKKEDRKKRIPFAPFVFCGAYLVFCTTFRGV